MGEMLTENIFVALRFRRRLNSSVWQQMPPGRKHRMMFLVMLLVFSACQRMETPPQTKIFREPDNEMKSIRSKQE